MSAPKMNEVFRNKIFNCSATEKWPLPDKSIDTIITSPPYWKQREAYIQNKHLQIGQERSPEQYIENLVNIFDEEGKRVLASHGQLWVNIGDVFSKKNKAVKWAVEKQQLQLPYRFAIEMQNRGWVLRNTLIWAKSVSFSDGTSKGGGMPSAVHDRLNLNYEPFFGFVKSIEERKPFYFDTSKFIFGKKKTKGFKKIDYFSNMDAIRIKTVWVNENGQRIDLFGRVAGSRPNAGASPKQHSVGQPNKQIFNHPFGKNPGSVWQINTDPFAGQKITHTSPYPINLIKKVISFSTPLYVCSKCFLPSAEIYNRNKAKLQLVKCSCNDEQVKGIVLDPFMGSGTTALASIDLNRDFCGFEINKEYVVEANKRICEKLPRLEKTLSEFI